MKKKIICISLIAVFIALFVSPAFIRAETAATTGAPDSGTVTTTGAPDSGTITTSGVGTPTGGCGSSGTGIQNPLKVCSVSDFIYKALDQALNFGYVIAALFIIYSGFLFVTARGNDEKLGKAKTTFYYTIIGTAILLGARVIAAIVENTVNALKK